MNPTNEHQEKKRLENPPKSIKFKIQRREKEGSDAYWETFELPYRRNLNVISALMDIRKNPVTVEGKQPVPGRVILREHAGDGKTMQFRYRTIKLQKGEFTTRLSGHGYAVDAYYLAPAGYADCWSPERPLGPKIGAARPGQRTKGGTRRK